jgi:hypothetical protein
MQPVTRVFVMMIGGLLLFTALYGCNSGGGGGGSNVAPKVRNSTNKAIGAMAMAFRSSVGRTRTFSATTTAAEEQPAVTTRATPIPIVCGGVIRGTVDIFSSSPFTNTSSGSVTFNGCDGLEGVLNVSFTRTDPSFTFVFGGNITDTFEGCTLTYQSTTLTGESENSLTATGIISGNCSDGETFTCNFLATDLEVDDDVDKECS